MISRSFNSRSAPRRFGDLPAGIYDEQVAASHRDPLLAFFSRHRLIISAAAVAGALLAWAGSHFLPKVYRAEVLVSAMSPESSSPLRGLIGQYGGLASLAGLDLDKAEGQTAMFVAMLKSRIFLEDFISKKNLLPVLFPKKWDVQHSKWIVHGRDRPPSLQDGYDVFSKKILRVVEEKDKELLTIRIEWRDPIQAADWANALVQQLNETARRRTLINADLSIDYLERELDHTQSVETRQSIYSLMQSEIAKRMMANTRPDFAFSVIDPAQVPEVDKPVSPVPLLFAALGFFAGAAMAMFVVLLFSSVEKVSDEPTG